MFYRMKKITALLLAMLMVFNLMPVSVLAEGVGSYASPYVGAGDGITLLAVSDEGKIQYSASGWINTTHTYTVPVYFYKEGTTTIVDSTKIKLQAQNDKTGASFDVGGIVGDGREFVSAKVADSVDDSGTSLRYLRVRKGELQSSNNGKDYKNIENHTGKAVYIAYRPVQLMVKFDLNGGSGTTPAAVTVDEAGRIITLPNGDGMSRNNYVLLGWSPSKDANSVGEKLGPNDTNGKAEIYPLGELYTVEKSQTLYAVWAQNSGTQSGTITVAVRDDGTVPGEPSIQNAAYTYLVSGKSVENVLKYFSPAQTVAGSAAVHAALTQAFWDELVTPNLRGLTGYNSETQEIVFYVIKYQAGDSKWHIDGVIRDKSNVYLDYNGNGATGGLTPDGVEVVKGNIVKVAEPGNYYEGTKWYALTRTGYEFAGWNTRQNGSGQTYQPGETITVEANTTLYAQWRALTNNITYSYTGDVPEGIHAPADQINIPYESEQHKPADPEEVVGYRFEGWETSDVEVATDGSYTMPNHNVAWTGNWVIDETQTKDLTATVDYSLGGDVQQEEHVGLKATVQVLQPDTLSTAGVEAKDFPGWKLDHITINDSKVDALPDAVNNGDAIVYHYIRNDFPYTVKFYKDAVSEVNHIADADVTYDPAELGMALADLKYSTDIAAERCPAGYQANGTVDQEHSLTAITADADRNVICVVLSKRTDLSYTVKYLKLNTNEELAKAKTVTGQTFGAQVTENAINIAGYTAVAPTSQTITIAVDSNEIVFYYTINSHEVTYKYDGEVPAGASTLPAEALYNYNETVTVAPDATAPGYTFSGWITKDATVADGKFTMPDNNVVLVGSFTANTDTKYTVEFYYQENGQYPDVATDQAEHTGTTDTAVSVTDTDKQPADKPGYVFDESAKNVLTGIVAGNGSLVLKVYFKQQFTVTYQPGTHGTFAEQTYGGRDYGVATPKFQGETTGDAGYTFAGWQPTVAETVTADATYVAQWMANTDTTYIVEHYQQNLNDDGYTLVVGDTENKNGTTNTAAAYAAKNYAGFTYQENQTTFWSHDDEQPTATILGDGSLVIRLYYDRNLYTVNYDLNGGTSAQTLEYPNLRYGAATPTIADPTWEKHTFKGWAPAIASTVTDNATYGAQWDENGEMRVELVSETLTYNGVEQSLSKVKVIIGNDERTMTIDEFNENYSTSLALTEGKGTDVKLADEAIGSYDGRLTDGPAIIEIAEKNYDVTYENGALTITPATLEVTTPDANKVYDGTALTAAGTITGFVNNETATFATTGAQTDVGESQNTYAITWNGTAKQSNYTVAETVGTLTVTEYAGEITVTTVGGSFTYNGQPHGATVSVSDLPDGYTLETATSSATATDVTTAVPATCDTLVIRNAEGEDVTGELNIKKVDDTIVVNPAAITVYAEDSRVYTGADQTLTIPAANAGGVVLGETLTLTDATITGNAAGVYTELDKAYTWSVAKANGTNSTGNYTIKVTGKLTITQQDNLAVTLTDQEYVYDGTAHFLKAAEVTSAGGETTLEYSIDRKTWYDSVEDVALGLTDVGEVTIYVRATNSNYSNTAVDSAVLKVTPKDVTITAQNHQFDYTGEEQSWAEYDVDGLVGSDKLSATVEGKIQYPAQSPVANVVTAHEFVTGDPNNYKVNYANGELTMDWGEKAAITIKAADDAWTYNGEARSNDAVSIIEGALQTGDVLVAQATGSVTNVADSTTGNNPVAEGYRVMNGTEDVTDKYEITAEAGTLTINKRAVTLTSATDSKTYDGTALTNDTVTVEGDGFATGEGATYDVTGTQTDAGNSANAFTYTLNDNTKAENYDITKTEGTLTVAPITDEVVVTIIGNTDTIVYDGNVQTVTGYTATANNPAYIVEGENCDFAFNGTSQATRKDVGTTNMGLTAEQFSNADTTNFTNVRFEVTDGWLTITPIATQIIITAGSDKKVYDGDPLTSDVFTYTPNVLVEGDVLQVTTAGERTDVGTAANKVASHKVVRGEGENQVDVTDNYSFGDYVDGTLEVTPRSVTITVNNAEKFFGESDPTFAGTVEGLVNGNDLGTVAYSRMNKDEAVGIYPDVLTANYTENKNYTVTVVPGDFTIKTATAAGATLTAQGGSWPYDGDPHAASAAVSGAEGFTVYYKVGDADWTTEAPFVTNVSERTVTVQVKATKTGYNDLFCDDVKLEITPRPITIIAASDEKVYDGTALSNGQYAVVDGHVDVVPADADFNADGRAVIGQETITATVTGSQTDVGSSDNTAADAKVIGDLGNYDVKYVKGTLEVTKRPVTITAAKASKLFGHDDPSFEPATLTDDSTAEGAEEPDCVAVLRTALDLAVIRTDKDAENGEEVGKHENVLTIQKDQETLEKEHTNYTFTITPADFEIMTNDQDLKVSAEDVTVPYDGRSHGVTAKATVAGQENADVEIRYWNPDTNAYDLETSPVYTNVQDTPVEVRFQASLEGYASVTGRATVTITKRPVVITVANDEKTYGYDDPAFADATMAGEKDNAQSGPVGEELKGIDRSVTRSDASDNTLGMHNDVLNIGTTEDELNAAYTNYTFTIVPGNFTIHLNTQDLTVSASDVEKMYDGTAYGVAPTASVKGATILYKDADGNYTLTECPTQTNAGELTVEFQASLEGYAPATGSAKVTITKRHVTFVGESGERTYNGSEYDLTNVTVDETQGQTLVAGHQANVTASAKGMLPETYPGIITAEADVRITDANDQDVTANYDITTVPGTLTITAIATPITITAADGTKMYDGSSLTNDGYTFTEGVLLEGDKLEAVVEGSATNVSDAGVNTVKTHQVMRGDVDVTKAYTFGAPVDGKLTITPRTVTMTSGDAEKPYDGKPLMNGTVTETGDGFVPGEGADYTVTGSQTLAGSSKNTFTYALKAGTLAENYAIDTVEGDLTVTANTTELKITSGTETWVYDGQPHSHPVYTVTYGDEAVTPNADGTFTLPTGDTLTISGAPVVTDVADTQDAKENNTFVYDLTNAEQYTKVETEVGTVTVARRPVTIQVNTKAHVYDGTEKTVTDEATKQEYTVAAPEENSGLLNGDTEKLDVVYGTDQAESKVLVGTYAAAVSAEGVKILRGADNADVTDNYAVTVNNGTLDINDGTTETPVDQYVVTKAHTGNGYNLGETVTFDITATNIYNETKTITLREIAGVTLAQSAFTDVPAGETVRTTATYTITEADILAGEFVNTVTATFDVKSFQSTDTVTTAATNAHLTITKTTTSTPANGTAYALGETITYDITVLNDGNVTVSNIEVMDTVAGYEPVMLTEGENAFTLAPGAAQTIPYTHVVTEQDILAGTVVNTATATGTSPANVPLPEVVPGSTEDDTEAPNPSFTLEKTLTNLPDKGYFTLGEEAAFDISVTNDGNLTLSGINVYEQLEGAVILEGEGYTVSDNVATIAILPVGETVVVKAAYTITEADLGAELVNIATADGTGPVDPEDPTPGEEEIPTDDAVTVTGIKTWNDGGNAYATRPDAITVNLLADGAEVAEQLVTADMGWVYTFTALPAHTADGAEIAYTVAEDAVAGYDAAYAEGSIVNTLQTYGVTVNYWLNNVGGTPAADSFYGTYQYGQPFNIASPAVLGYNVNQERVTGTVLGDVTFDVIYTPAAFTIAVHYVYQDGTEALATYRDTLLYGEGFYVATPALAGYTPNIRMVAGNMEARHMSYTVIYAPEDTVITIDEYGVPLGLGNMVMNVGDCIE